MLELVGLGKRYGTRYVVQDVSIDVEHGRITGLLGPNGAGKSTILHCLTGVVTPDDGAVLLGGELLTPQLRRTRLGFCPDDLPMPDLLTAREYLQLLTGVRQVRVRASALDEMLAGLGLLEASGSLVSTYSHGMKRKLQLVAALLHRPDVLVLDEPFRGLDPESSAILKDLLVRYAAADRAVLISTHDLLVAEQMCDQVAVLAAGRLVAVAAPSELTQAQGDTLEDAFLALTGLRERAHASAEKFFSGLGGIRS